MLNQPTLIKILKDKLDDKPESIAYEEILNFFSKSCQLTNIDIEDFDMSNIASTNLEAIQSISSTF